MVVPCRCEVLANDERYAIVCGHWRVQVEWHPMCWVPDLIPYARKHSIVLQAYSSLGSGENRLFEHEVVKEVRASGRIFKGRRGSDSF